jgi:hypothetical protein
VNRKLKSLIPHNDVVYDDKQIIGDLHDAVARAEADYLGRLAPPPSVLAKAIAVVSRRRTAAEPDSVTYVLKRVRIFGFEICTGWQVVAHPLGGGPPDSGYAFGPCSSSQFQPPPWEPATLPPHPPPAASPAP